MKRKTIPPAWQSYRSRNWLAVAVLIGGLPGAFLVAIIAALVLGRLSQILLFAAVVLWCVALGWAAFRVTRWPCPRCNASWLAGQEPRLGASRQCAGCGLGLYEEP